jgi:hypothetical protein
LWFLRNSRSRGGEMRGFFAALRMTTGRIRPN